MIRISDLLRIAKEYSNIIYSIVKLYIRSGNYFTVTGKPKMTPAYVGA